MQREKNEGAFKRREQVIQSGSCRRKRTSGGKGKLRLGMDWEVRLRLWDFCCIIKENQ